MLGREELERLRLEKRTLVAESSVNRLALQTEWQNLCDAGARALEPVQVFRASSPWALAVAALAGLAFLRRPRQPKSAVGSIASFLRLAQTAYSLWQSFRGASPRAGSGETAWPAEGDAEL